jgi:hypothetical protein
VREALDKGSLRGESFSEARNEVSLKGNKETSEAGRRRWHASKGGGYCGDRTEVREWHEDTRRVSEGVRWIPKEELQRAAQRADLTVTQNQNGKASLILPDQSVWRHLDTSTWYSVPVRQRRLNFFSNVSFKYTQVGDSHT